MKTEFNPHYVDIKSAIKKRRLVDPYFVGRYSLSPYMACSHGCKYCDGRAEKYYVQGDFEKDIIIRKNIPEILSSEIGKIRERGTIFIGSGISDAYQPAEKDCKLMKQISETLCKYNCSASVMTKSNIILRDIDNWDTLNQKNGFTLYVSLVFTNDELRQVIEPNASSVAERIETLKKFKERGISIAVSAMPLIPFLGDSEKQIRELYNKLEKIGIDFIIPASLTLRPGKQKDLFLQVIQKNYPKYLNDFKLIFSENRQSGSAKKNYITTLNQRLYNVMRDFDIPKIMPHRIYKKRFPIYDEIYILLNHMTSLYSSNRSSINRLIKSFENYHKWLDAEKRIFNRKRKTSERQFEAKFELLLKNGEMGQILNNAKLNNFINQIVFNDATFDYVKLKLV